jgi:hypothetical protein
VSLTSVAGRSYAVAEHESAIDAGPAGVLFPAAMRLRAASPLSSLVALNAAVLFSPAVQY